MRGFLPIIFFTMVASNVLIRSDELDVPKQPQPDEQYFEAFAKYFYEKYGEKLIGPPGMPGLQYDEVLVQNILKRISLLEAKTAFLQEECGSPLEKLYKKIKSLF